MKLIKLQPSPYIDNIVDGHELTKLPYPYFVHEDGTLEGAYADWGSKAVIGFQDDLHIQQIDVWWEAILTDPGLAVGKYVVTRERNGGMAAHEHAIESVEALTKENE